MNRFQGVLVSLVATSVACEPASHDDLLLGCDGPATQADYARAQEAVAAIDPSEGTPPTLRFCAGTHEAPAFASLLPITVEPFDGASGEVLLEGDSAWTAPGLTVSGIDVSGDLSLDGSDLSLSDVQVASILRTGPANALAGAVMLEDVVADDIHLDWASTVRLDGVDASSLEVFAMNVEIVDSAFDADTSDGIAVEIGGVDVLVADSVVHAAGTALVGSGVNLTIERTEIVGGSARSGLGTAAMVVGQEVVLRDTTIRLEEARGEGGSLLDLAGTGEASLTLDHVTFGPGLDETPEKVTVTVLDTIESQTLTVIGTEWGGAVARAEYTEGPAALPAPASDFTCTTGPTAASLHCE